MYVGTYALPNKPSLTIYNPIKVPNNLTSRTTINETRKRKNKSKMAKNILKEAIADAKAVREVALANAKAALEEAFTPKLQSMLSAKLSEELEDEDLQEGEDTIDELFDMDKDMDEDMYDEDMYEGEEDDFSEEIDLEEILNELGMDEGMVCEVCGTIHEGSCGMMEGGKKKLDPVGKEDGDIDNDGDEDKTDDYLANRRKAVSKSIKKEHTENFNLDLLLEKINALSMDNDPEVIFEIEDDLNEEEKDKDLGQTGPTGGDTPKGKKKKTSTKDDAPKGKKRKGGPEPKDDLPDDIKESLIATKRELTKTRAILETVKYELNEVNLLNSKLLYVNRIFKANNLDEEQKLRVVETLDKAESTKEAKLIYETIKGTFNIRNVNPKKSIREGLGMASSAAGLSTARKPILNESNDMVSRMQKLANIKIKQ